jgi:hypothetical protein
MTLHVGSVDLEGRTWFMINPGYSGSRKRMLLREWEVLRQYSPFEVARVNAEGKIESYPGPHKVLRIIFAREDRFKLLFAPWIKAVEEEVFKAHNFLPHFVKTMNRLQIKEALQRRIGRYTFVTVIDHTAFESTVRSEIFLEWIAPIYRLWGIPELYIRIIAGWQHIHHKSGRMRVKGGTMSGEMDTSLRNGLVNHLLMLAVPGSSGMDWLIEGDDLIIGSNHKPDLSIFTHCGFSITAEDHDHPGTAGFCGWYFSKFTGNSFKPPVKVMNLFFVGRDLSLYKQEYRAARYAAKVMMCCQEHPRSPLTYNLGDTVESETAIHEKGVYEVEKLMKAGIEVTEKKGVFVSEFKQAKAFPPTWEDRCEYFELWGITPAEQIRIEQEGAWKSPTFALWVERNFPAQHRMRYTNVARRAPAYF